MSTGLAQEDWDKLYSKKIKKVSKWYKENLKHPSTPVICQNCGIEFDAYIRELKRGRGKFCSHSCAGTYHALLKHATQSQEGELNPNWKGGISSNNYHYKLIQKQRYPKETKVRDQTYEKIRTGKLIRQPCEVCKSNDGVHAHHDDYDKPDDVRWLCITHHRELHT